VRASVARSLQAFTATSGKNHGHLGIFHGHQIFFITATFSAIFLYFLPLLLIDPAATGVLLLRLWLLLLVSLAFLLLLRSLLMPTSLQLLAFLLLLGCHKLVSDCMAHGHFYGHQFSTDI
jgi:hypothetical protein